MSLWQKAVNLERMSAAEMNCRKLVSAAPHGCTMLEATKLGLLPATFTFESQAAETDSACAQQTTVTCRHIYACSKQDCLISCIKASHQITPCHTMQEEACMRTACHGVASHPAPRVTPQATLDKKLDCSVVPRHVCVCVCL